MPVDEARRFPLVPNMVAGGDDISASGIKLVADLLGDPEPAGGVLAIDDDEVESELAAQARQLLDRRRPPGAADQITEEKESHDRPVASGDPMQGTLGRQPVEPLIEMRVGHGLDFL